MKWTKSKYKHVNVQRKKVQMKDFHRLMWKDKDVWQVQPRIFTKQSKTLQQKNKTKRERQR